MKPTAFTEANWKAVAPRARSGAKPRPVVIDGRSLVRPSAEEIGRGDTTSSRWELSWRDRFRLVVGGAVWVTLLTRVHPAIQLDTEPLLPPWVSTQGIGRRLRAAVAEIRRLEGAITRRE